VDKNGAPSRRSIEGKGGEFSWFYFKQGTGRPLWREPRSVGRAVGAARGGSKKTKFPLEQQGDRTGGCGRFTSGRPNPVCALIVGHIQGGLSATKKPKAPVGWVRRTLMGAARVFWSQFAIPGIFHVRSVGRRGKFIAFSPDIGKKKNKRARSRASRSGPAEFLASSLSSREKTGDFLCDGRGSGQPGSHDQRFPEGRNSLPSCAGKSSPGELFKLFGWDWLGPGHLAGSHLGTMGKYQNWEYGSPWYEWLRQIKIGLEKNMFLCFYFSCAFQVYPPCIKA